MTEEGAPWLVVRLKPQQGERAAKNAQQQGYEWYAPRGMFRSERTHKLRVEALFPGYAFARHPSRLWQSLSGTFGVIEVLRISEDKPASLPHAQIARWQAREGSDGLVRLEAREFEIGEHVHIDGSLSGDGVVDGMAARDRIDVLMQIMGRWTRVQVDVRDVTRD